MYTHTLTHTHSLTHSHTHTHTYTHTHTHTHTHTCTPQKMDTEEASVSMKLEVLGEVRNIENLLTYTYIDAHILCIIVIYYIYIRIYVHVHVCNTFLM